MAALRWILSLATDILGFTDSPSLQSDDGGAANGRGAWFDDEAVTIATTALVNAEASALFLWFDESGTPSKSPEYSNTASSRVVRGANTFPLLSGEGARILYVMRVGDASLEPPSSEQATADYMAERTEWGVFPLASTLALLSPLYAVLSTIYAPLLNPMLAPPSSSDGVGASGGGGDDDDGTASLLSGVLGSRAAGGASVALGRSQGGGSVAGGATVHSWGGGAPLMRTLLAGSVAGDVAMGTVTSLGDDASAASRAPLPMARDSGLLSVADATRAELKVALARLDAAVRTTAQQISSHVVYFYVPPALLVQARDVVAARSSGQCDDRTPPPPALIETIASLVRGWCATIDTAAGPVPERDKGTRPLSELEMWRARTATLSSVLDQMGSPDVVTMLHAIEGGNVREESSDNATINDDADGGDPFTFNAFVVSTSSLRCALATARDNARFLSTLERQFKVLACGSLAAISEVLPSLLNGLRMVWIVSRHYNSASTFGPLLFRIAAELVERVVADVGVRPLLRLAQRRPDSALAAACTARGVLDLWRSAYYATRARIEEESGGGAECRWEFDRRTLFERSEHVAAVLSDVERVVRITTDVAAFFRAPEVASIATDADVFETLRHAAARPAHPLVRLHYNPFDRSRSSKWTADVLAFDTRIADIEARTRAFVHTAFGQLCSSEAALDLLDRLHGMRMRDSLREIVDANVESIARRARDELADTAVLFQAQCSAPPQLRGSPRVAGIIEWADALFRRAKRTMVRLRAAPALLDSVEGAALLKDYRAFARRLDGFIQLHFSEWAAVASSTVPELQQMSVLGPALLNEPICASDALTAGTLPAGGVAATAAAATAVLLYPALAADREASRMPPPPYHVNLPTRFLAVLADCRRLEQLGFPVPPPALAIALQFDQLATYAARLDALLVRYHGVLATLTAAEAALLQLHLAQLRAALRPGFAPLNWSSLHVLAFANEAGVAVADFENMLARLRKAVALLEDAEVAIAGARLVDPRDFDGDTGDVAAVAGAVEQRRIGRLRAAASHYYSAHAVLMQVETIVVGTATATSPPLAEYYRYWERRFFNAVTTMILGSMAALQVALGLVSRRRQHNDGPHCTTDAATSDARTANSDATARGRPPMICLHASLSGPDVVLSPDLNAVSKFLRRTVNQV